LASEHPERARYRWFPQAQANGSWVVVKVEVPPRARVDPLTEETRADEKPPYPADPRPPVDPNVAGGF
jgi:hypothetical protein